MPPKRRLLEKKDEINNDVKKIKNKENEEKDHSKVILDEVEEKIKIEVSNFNEKHKNEDEVDDGRPICEYDENCYRKNPIHFQQMRHPNLKSKKLGLVKKVNSEMKDDSNKNELKSEKNGKPKLQRTLSAKDVEKVSFLNSKF